MKIEEFTDSDASAVILRALRLLAIMTLIAFAVVWWKMGWRSAGMLLAGSAVSAAGLWKWLRLMTAMMTRLMPANDGRPAQPVGMVLIGFFVTLGLMLTVLYVSLKTLDGSIYALFVGLGMGILAMTVEALKVTREWTA